VNALWGACVLGYEFSVDVIAPLASAVSALVGEFKAEHAQACLQCHVLNAIFPIDVLNKLWEIFHSTEPSPSITSRLHSNILDQLQILGFQVDEEVPHLEGLVVVDIVVTLPDGRRVAIEVDGPTHYLRPSLFKEKGPPVETSATIMRNKILRSRAAGFSHVFVIPFFTWELLEGVGTKQREYILGLFTSAGISKEGMGLQATTTTLLAL